MQAIIDWIETWAGAWGPTLVTVVVMALAITLGLIVHRLILEILRRATGHTRSRSDDLLLVHTARPGKWILVAVALALAQRLAPLPPSAMELWRQSAGFVLPALVGWWAVGLINAVKAGVELRADISVSDNLQARRRRTRVGILTRIAVILVLLLTISMMLLSIPGVRNVGLTLMASAGLVGLAVGAAAQPALKNLIAGVQMAFTEPIRIDDVVVIAGEWGRIEDIRLTYVVVKVWDERRLVVPVSKFLEEPFQNWTRESAQLLGSAFLYLDPTADVARLRQALEEIVRASDKWDGRFFNLQVTDLKEETMEVRILVTAADASTAFDLRCDVREAMMKFVSQQMPQALPKRRQSTAVEAPDTRSGAPQPA